MNTLKAEKRSMDIKAKKLRREGFVTGNVFGKKLAESIPVKIEKSAIEKLLKTSHKGSQIMLDIDGESYQVLIKDVEYNPLKGQVDEIDFQALVSDEKVHSVAVVYGVLEQFLEEIQLRALPAALVDKIEINVGELKVGESIKVKDLPIYQNKDIDILTDPEATVVTIQEVHNAPEADEEAEESTEA